MLCEKVSLRGAKRKRVEEPDDEGSRKRQQSGTGDLHGLSNLPSQVESIEFVLDDEYVA